MYIPAHFAEKDTQALLQLIRDNGFGTLVVADSAGIEANHLPFHWRACEEAPLGLLQCHVARANPLWQRLNGDTRVLAIFQGPNAYVSPSWYPSKAESPRVVPTWNYQAVHVRGVARAVEEPQWLEQHLRQLTDLHEAGRAQPWSFDDAPAEFTRKLTRAIVGIEIRIESVCGKLKASQNQPEVNRAGVRVGLQEEPLAVAREMAELIR